MLEYSHHDHKTKADPTKPYFLRHTKHQKKKPPRQSHVQRPPKCHGWQPARPCCGRGSCRAGRGEQTKRSGEQAEQRTNVRNQHHQRRAKGLFRFVVMARGARRQQIRAVEHREERGVRGRSDIKFREGRSEKSVQPQPRIVKS